MDEDACRAQIPSECNTPKTLPTLVHCQRLPASPAVTSVNTQHHGCNEPLQQTCLKHTDAPVPCDTCERHSPETLPTKAASHSNLGAPSVPSIDSQDAGLPLTGSAGRRRPRRAATQHVANYADASDSDTDSDGDGGPNHVHNSFTAGFEGDGDEAAGKDERPRKRRKFLLRPPQRGRSAALKSKSPHRAGLYSTYTKRPMKLEEVVQIATVANRASSQPTPPTAELGATIAEYSGWPLESASLICTMDCGKPLLQLQFRLPPVHDGASRVAQDGLGSERAVGKSRRAPSAKVRYTSSEDDLLLELKSKKQLPWSKIHKRFCEKFPARPVESLQVHYSTKLKPRGVF